MWQATANIILNWGKLKRFPLRSEIRPPLPFLFSTASLNCSNQVGKWPKKCILNGTEEVKLSLGTAYIIPHIENPKDSNENFDN